MKYNNREIWISFFTIILITATYIIVVINSGFIPSAGDLYGHYLGIIGFVLMLLTETLYTLRKRARVARWGRMSTWLKLHIYTGLVGPYMVLLHTSWKYNGLAGIVTLLTIIIVFSGFIGRYIYTSVPRTADGLELASYELEQHIEDREAELQLWLNTHEVIVRELPQSIIEPENISHTHYYFFIGAIVHDWNQRWRWWKQKRILDSAKRTQIAQLEIIIKRRRILRHQVTSLAMARQLLSLWYEIHIPIGASLFTAAFVHIVAAVYYSI